MEAEIWQGLNAKWENFLEEYFIKYWCKEVDPHDWNVHKFIGQTDPQNKLLLINRTDNPLERYNRELKTYFPTARPSMMDSVHTIRDHANTYVKLIAAKADGNYGAEREHS